MNPSGNPHNLSPRELQIIKFASVGLTDTAMATKLGISEATVSTYWGRVRIKLGPLNRTELVAIFIRGQQEDGVRALREENAQLLAELQRSVAVSGQPDSLDSQIFENAPDAIIIVSQNGEVVRANQAACEMFDRSMTEMKGLSLLNLIPERFAEAHQRHREDYFNDPHRRAMGEHLETPAKRKDGTEFLVRASLSAVVTASGMLVTCILRPIMERLEVEASW